MPDSYVMVSLEEEQAKRLAQVIANDTCRRILDHLTKGSATESQLAKELALPLSTVHYNLKLLREARLVRADEFHYSPKGKEVLHYTLENKYIVIAPRSEKGVLDRLKEILPLGVITLAALYVGFFASRYLRPFGTARTQAFASPLASRAATEAAPFADEARGSFAEHAGDLLGANAADVAGEAANASARIAADAANITPPLPPAAHDLSQVVISHPTPHWAWFVAGAACVLIVVLIIRWWRRRR